MSLTPEQIEAGFQPMDTAPRDGTIIAVCYHEWDVQTNPVRYQMAQWLYDGAEFAFCAPWQTDNRVWADGWMTLEKFAAYREPKP